RDVNTLAGYYNVAWNWNQPYPADNGTYGYSGNNDAYPGNNNYGYPDRTGTRLTGTYRLNSSQSDDVSTAIDRSIAYYSNDQRDTVRRTLERRLASPEMIAIDKNGR